MKRYELIQQLREQESFAILELCEAMEVSRSGFYAWKKRPRCARENENQRLVEAMHEVHAHRHTKSYGSPRMTEELRELNLYASENRVARLMRREGIRAQAKRAFRPKTTVQDEEAPCESLPIAWRNWRKSRHLDKLWPAISPTWLPGKAGSTWRW